MEHRQSLRFMVEFSATFRGDATGVGTVYNLGMGGCKVVSDLVVTMGTVLQVHLQVPDQTTAIMVKAAAVRWTMDNEFGIEFLGLEECERARLLQYLLRLERAAA